VTVFLAHSRPGHMRRLVRGWRKLTSWHQPNQACLERWCPLRLSGSVHQPLLRPHGAMRVQKTIRRTADQLPKEGSTTYALPCEFGRHFSEVAKTTFAGSSPLSPATQWRLCGRHWGNDRGNCCGMAVCCNCRRSRPRLVQIEILRHVNCTGLDLGIGEVTGDLCA